MAKGQTKTLDAPENSGLSGSRPAVDTRRSEPPPSKLQGLVARLRRLLEPGQDGPALRGVVGSLEQISIPDLVQVLSRGRKTGALRVTAPGEDGTVHFKDGAVIHAESRALRGEEAFYALIGVSSGQFSLDPDVIPSEETITKSPEMLLLEAMRRLDESSTSS